MADDPLTDAIRALLAIAEASDRPDLADRTKAAAVRATRSDTIVCVVGEFKQGKSSLVNSLVRRDVCPVDDDLATSVITMVQYAETPSAIVRRKEGNKAIAESVDVDDVANWASEQGNPGNEKAVDRVDVFLPSKILEDGLTLVDTPGMGGLGGGHAAATMAFLPFADGLILVSDTSSELTAPEEEFLRQATELCPTVMLAATKIDLYAEWERIVALDREHLDKRDATIPTVAISSYLRDVALETRDRQLNLDSGYPELLDVLQRRVVAPAKATAKHRAVNDLRGVAGLLRTGAEEELRLLDDPEDRQQALETLERNTARLEHLRGPAARWSTVLSDRITDLQTSVSHRFRGEMRNISRDMDVRVEDLTRSSDWEAVTRDAQTQVSESAARAFSTIQKSWAEIHHELAELLDAEDLIAFDASRTERERSDLSDYWQGTESLQQDENKGLAGVRSVVGVGQSFGSSQFMFSNLSGVSKFGMSLGVFAAGPVLVGGFVLIGGMKVFDDRKRKFSARKQRLRQQVRSFADNVQFEISDELGNLVREAQRSLRDEFMDRISELQTTYSETIQRARADAQRSEQEQGQRRDALQNCIAALDGADAALAKASS